MERKKLRLRTVGRLVVRNIVTWKNPLDPIIEYFGGPLEFQLKTSLILMPVDLFTDIFTGICYFWNGHWLEGILTYGIILGAGIGLSIGFLGDAKWGPFIQSNIGRIGRIWKYFLIFPPGLLPFVCARMYLGFLNEEKIKEDKDEEREERRKGFHDLFLKSNWCEAVYEGKWESLLQLQATLHVDIGRGGSRSFLDYVPIAHFVKEMYSLTSGVYELTSYHFEEKFGRTDPTPVMSRIYGMLYTGISILVPVVGVIAVRRAASGECNRYSFRLVGPVFDEVGAVVAFIVIYYTAVGIFYAVCMIVAKVGKLNAAMTFHVGVIGLYANVGAFWFVVSESSRLNHSVGGGLIFFSVGTVIACGFAREFAEFSALMMSSRMKEVVERRGRERRIEELTKKLQA